MKILELENAKKTKKIDASMTRIAKKQNNKS